MAEEQALEPTPARRSVLPRLLLVALLMLVVAVVVNLKDIRAIAAGERTVTSVLYGKQSLGEMMGATFKFPAPTGPEDAKVRIWVLAQEGNSCHQPVIPVWMAVGDLEPDRVRVEYYNTYAAPPREDGTPIEVGCDTGVAINGEIKFEIGEGESRRTIYFTGPTPMVPPTPPPGSQGPAMPMSGPHGWTHQDVVDVVNTEIGEAYGKPGKLTLARLQQAMGEAAARIPKPDEGATVQHGQPARGSQDRSGPGESTG